MPAECHVCGNALNDEERFICTPCLETMPRTGFHRIKNNPVEERFAGQFPFAAATGHFFYSRDSALARVIQDMKYRWFPSIGEKLGKITGEELYSAGFLNDVSYVVPLPMYFWKKAKRGYNQVDYIARGIAQSCGAEVIDALEMTRGRKTQTSLDRKHRLDNAAGLFKVKTNIDLNSKGVLLVDDICTTGATMGAAAKSLTDAFPGLRLYILALAVAF